MLQRVLQLPVVSSTCESLQRTYASTKEAHPLMASVCEVYERGVQGASALALWSVEPVVRRLEPQCESSNAAGGEGTGGTRQGEPPVVLAAAHSTPGAAPSLSHQPALVLLPEAVTVANNLACRGLDHLEEKIPALQYPVDKVGHGWDSRSLWDPAAPLWSTWCFSYGAGSGLASRLPLVIAGGEGLLRGTPKQGAGHKGWVAPRYRSAVCCVPSPPAASSPGCGKLSCPSWGCLLVRPRLGAPWSLWLSPATRSTPAGLFSISLPEARLRTEGHHLHPHPKCQKHHWQLHGQDPGAGGGGL